MFTKLAYIYGMKLLNSKIYKIIDNTNGNIYIGSTCLTLEQRLKAHREKYYEKRKYGKGNSSYDIIKNNDYKIELLENFPCKTKQELLKKEREYIENTKCINILRPIITYQEMLDKTKQWKTNNKDKVKIYGQTKYEKHKDKILESRKIYYEANKDKIKERKSVKIQCDICNSTITRGILAQHKRSLKCKNYKKDNIN
jgi:hypothetical protein